jgi:hypothetical protein
MAPTKIGYQGSEHSSGELIIYPRGKDPIILSDVAKIQFDAKRNYDKKNALVSLATNKSIGTGSGTWTATIKASRSREADLLDKIVDDDWIDVVFYRHGRPYHTMRGLTKEIRVDEKVSGKGATSRNYLLSGKDFGSIFEETQVWFAPLNDPLMAGGVSQQVFGGTETLLGNPDVVVKGFLLGFLKAIGSMGRATWELPKAVPNGGGSVFVDAVKFNTDGFLNNPKPPRTAINPSWMDVNGMIWALAQEWSDPVFCELFCDTIMSQQIDVTSPTIPEEAPVDQTQMVVRFRNRPFPLVEGSSIISEGCTIDSLFSGMNSPYFKLPLHELSRQMITESNIGKSGYERFNAFMLGPQISQNIGLAALDIQMPYWSDEDMLYHGLRRFDIESKYVGLNSDLLTLCKFQRAKIRDWYAMGPYLLNGNIALGRGFPQIHVGERVKVLGAGKDSKDTTYYVEQVAHNWNFGSTIKTNLGVTRGWRGDDKSYLDALLKIVELYNEGVRAEALTEGAIA